MTVKSHEIKGIRQQWHVFHTGLLVYNISVVEGYISAVWASWYSVVKGSKRWRSSFGRVMALTPREDAGPEPHLPHPHFFVLHNVTLSLVTNDKQLLPQCYIFALPAAPILKANSFFFFLKNASNSQSIGRVLLWIALSRLFAACGLCGKRDDLRCFFLYTVLCTVKTQHTSNKMQ